MQKPLTRRFPSLTAYMFLLPWFTGILVFSAIPILSSLYLSFTSYDFADSAKWTGMHNYIRLFTEDMKFIAALKVTFTYVLVGVPIQLILSLLLAMVLNLGLRGEGIYRSVYYIPSLIGGSVAVAILWRQMFGADGLVNQFLSVFGLDFPSWIRSPKYALAAIVFLKLWQFGAPMIIFLAGLKGIPRELYEASSMDGANKFRQFLAVTLPMLSPVILFNGIMGMINGFQAFNPSYIISEGTGGPINSTLFYTLYLYQAAFKNYQMGYASALAWVLILIIALFAALMFLFSKKMVHYDN